VLPSTGDIDDSLLPYIHDASHIQVKTSTEFMNASDATGKFPFPTLSGWNYILVSIPKGYVHFELLRRRTAPEYLRAYKAMYAFYTGLGKTPTIQQLDKVVQ
jgi:hypothetical protein